MKKTFALLVILSCGICGCSTVQPGPETYPTYTYAQPLDLVFLKTYETLNQEPNWMPNFTDKSRGIIEFRNTLYGNLSDADVQHGRYLVKRVKADQTSVEFDPDNSKCKGDTCLKLLEKVNKALSGLPVYQQPEEKPAGT